MTDFLIILLYLILYVIAASSLKAAIFLYILFIPLRNLIDIHILGLFTPAIIFFFILFFHFFRNGYIHNLGKYIKTPNLKRLSIFIAFFAITVYILTIRQRVLFEEYSGVEISVSWVINRTVTSFMLLINLLILVNICFLNQRYRNAAYKALVFSSIVVVFSLYFSQFLDSIGINVRDEFEYEVSGFQELGRVSGLYEGGDANSVSTFLNLIIAVVLVNHAANRKHLTIRSLLIIVFLATGVLITGSRMGFVTLVVITAYYILVLNVKTYRLTARTFANVFLFTIAVIGVAYLAIQHDRFALVFARIADQGLTDEVVTTGHRYIRWMGFIEHTMSKTSWFLWGSDEVYYAFTIGDYRDPHNLFISIFYINGFIILFVFVRTFILMVHSLLKTKLLALSTPLLLVVIVSTMIISQTNNINLLIVYLGILIQTHNTGRIFPRTKIITRNL